MSFITKPEEVLHHIRVRLRRNNLPDAEGAYSARTVSEKAMTIEEVCAALINRGGSSANYNDLVAHVRQFFDEAAYQLCNGFAVDTGFFSVYPVIGGYFDTEKGDIEPKEHPVSFRFRVLDKLRDLARHIKVEVIGASIGGSIVSLFDDESGTENKTITPGGLFRLRGNKIKVAGDDPDVGVYFVSHNNPSVRYKVSQRLLYNTCRKVIGIVPPLPAGEYGIEVKTQFTIGGINLREPRTIHNEQITVNN